MSVTLDDLRTAYTLGRRNQNELTIEMCSRLGWTREKTELVFTNMVKRRVCSVKRSATGRPSLILRDEEVAKIVRALEETDYKVFEAIEAAGNSGAWTRDIASTCRLPSHQVSKSVTLLCDVKKLIKPLKSIHQKNRKLYILATLNPSAEIVGGSFYRDGEFDHELVAKLREQMLHVLRNRSQAGFSDIQEFVKSSGIGSSLSAEDLLTIIKTLELEQAVTRSRNPRGEIVFMASRWEDADDVYASTPCASCPIASKCLRGTGEEPVCPERCQYIDYWLKYDTEYTHAPTDKELGDNSSARPIT